MALQSWTTNGSTGKNNWYWRQIVEDVGYDVATNTSTVYVTAQIKGTYWYGTVYTSINCNGEVRNETHNYSSATYFSDWTTIQWASFTVSHNSDGTKTIGVSTSLDAPGISPYNASASGSYTLTTIPRATPCPAVSGYIEDFCDFNLSPYAAFSHSINLSWKNKNYYLQSDGTLGSSEYKFGYSEKPIFDIDASYYQEFTDSDKMNATTTLRTYSGTTLIGTTTNTFTFICNPAKCNPSITSYEFYDNNNITVALTNNNLDIISGASNVIVNPTIKISSQYDTATTISRMIADGVQYSEIPFNVGTLQKNYVDVTIYNSRNMYYQTSLQGKGRFIQYFPTTFNISKLARPEPTTGEVSIKYSGNIFNDYFDVNKQHKNTLIITWKYREKGTSEYTNGGTLSPTLKDNTYSGEESLGTIFDYQKQYEFIFTITDSIYTYDTTVQNVPRGYPIFYWTKDKVRILEDLYVKDMKLGGEFYSTEETKIGTWIDGKPLYRKVLSKAGLHSETKENINHNITNPDKIWITGGFVYSIARVVTLPMVGYNGELTSKVDVWVETNESAIKLYSNGGWGNEWTFYIIINYTKTTDVVETNKLLINYDVPENEESDS